MGNKRIIAEIPLERSTAEEILVEMKKHNIIEKIIEELSRLIEDKKYDISLSRN
jgi:hypothetical protein